MQDVLFKDFSDYFVCGLFLFIPIYLLFIIFPISFFTRKKTLRTSDGFIIPLDKPIKYFNVKSEDEIAQKLLNSMSEQEKSNFIEDIVSNFSGYHQYDFDRNDCLNESNRRRLLFTKELIKFIGEEKLKDLTKTTKYISFTWYKVVRDIRESSTLYSGGHNSCELMTLDQVKKYSNIES